MIAGNPDHQDDAPQDSSKHSLVLVIDASPQLHNASVCFTLLVTGFSWPGPGHSITLAMAVMTRLASA